MTTTTVMMKMTKNALGRDLGEEIRRVADWCVFDSVVVR